LRSGYEAHNEKGELYRDSMSPKRSHEPDEREHSLRGGHTRSCVTLYARCPSKTGLQHVRRLITLHCMKCNQNAYCITLKQPARFRPHFVPPALAMNRFADSSSAAPKGALPYLFEKTLATLVRIVTETLYHWYMRPAVDLQGMVLTKQSCQFPKMHLSS